MAGANVIDVVREGERTRLVMADRDLGAMRWAGLFVIGFGMAFSGFAVFWMAGASGLLFGGPFHWVHAIFALFGLPFFLVGLVPIRAGLVMLLPGNTEIVLSGETVMEVVRAGIFRMRSRVKAAQVRTLRVMQSRDARRGWLEVETAGRGRTRKWASGYSDGELKELAQHIRVEMERFGAAGILRVGGGESESTEEGAGPKVELDVVPVTEGDKQGAAMPVEYARDDQPAGSRVQFAEIEGGGGLTFVKPRTGFRGPSLFFLLFSTVWSGITGVIFVVLLVSMAGDFEWDKLFPLAFVLFFMAIGVVLLCISVHMAFSRSVLVATQAGIVFTTKGPLRSSEWQVDAGDIGQIVAGPSGTTINDKQLLQVQVQLKSTGKQKGVFTGLSDEEIFWVATRLRTYYAVIP